MRGRRGARLSPFEMPAKCLHNTRIIREFVRKLVKSPVFHEYNSMSLQIMSEIRYILSRTQELLNYTSSMELRSYFLCIFIQSCRWAAKACRKGTTRKENLTGVFHVADCNCVADPKHSKSLFLKKNQAILHNAENIFGVASCHKKAIFLLTFVRLVREC